MREFIAIVILILFGGVCITALVAPFIWLDSIECHRKWEGSGFASQWGIISGCRIEVAKDRWIPEANYRELP